MVCANERQRQITVAVNTRVMAQIESTLPRLECFAHVQLQPNHVALGIRASCTQHIRLTGAAKERLYLPSIQELVWYLNLLIPHKLRNTLAQPIIGRARVDAAI